MTPISADLLAERIAWLGELFPEVVTEGKIDFDKLRIGLGDLVDGRPERYSFTWAGKRDAIQLLQIPSRATLGPVPDESVSFEETKHLFIEGDNLEALKLLHKAYFGQVRMIYIDPPYNTAWPDPVDNEANIKWVRDYSEATAPHSEEGGYIGFMADDDQGRIKANYRGNYERLVQIKRKYDPDKGRTTRTSFMG